MIGARIRAAFSRPDPALLAAFRNLPASDVADATGRLYVVEPGIHYVGGCSGADPRSGGGPGSGAPLLVGPALTVLTRPDDHLMVQAAIDLAEPGDVIVVSAGGSTTAMIGELVSVWAARRGVAGFVIDGSVRDVEALAVPTFARGVSPRAPFRAAPGEIGYPVGLGGLAVAAGDIVIADADGIVVVPKRDAAAVLERAQAVQATSTRSLADIEAGTFDRTWIAAALRTAGVSSERDEEDIGAKPV